MKKDSIIDYLGFITFRVLSPLIRILPAGVSLFFGRSLGEALYYFDLKHKSLVYSNIKQALGSKLSPGQLNNMTKEFYRRFGQSLIEILFVPSINQKYITKFIKLEGRAHIDEAFKRGKGVLFLAVHAGSWELSNVICANLGFPFNLLVRDQGFPRLNKLLSSYRQQKGCKLIQRENETREIIRVLKNNESIGLTADQGGRLGLAVKFFGKDASFASGAIRLALKYGATILPSYYTRVKGQYHKVIVEPPFQIKESQDKEEGLKENLERLAAIFERLILAYPQEYLWSYKIWKYTREKKVLLLSDDKVGHLRQAQAAAKIIADYLQTQGIKADIDTVEAVFKGNLARNSLTLSSCLAGKYRCQGCLWCLRKFLQEGSYKALVSTKPDIVISCGSALAPINYVLSRENLAKSVVIMQPSFLSARRFDLVIVPKHDKFPKRKNVLFTQGALNLIDDNYLASCSRDLLASARIDNKFTLGLLIGGDAKSYRLNLDRMREVVRQIKMALEKMDGQVLITTSRRTSAEIETLIKQEFQDYRRCKFLVIANENNLDYAVGGILALSQIIITSPESISMISEAASSKKYVIVFNDQGLSRKHRLFLGNFVRGKYISLAEPEKLCEKIADIWRVRPKVAILPDNALVSEAIKRVL